MKGLIRTIIIMTVLIIVGLGTSAFIYADLVNRLATAHERGGEDGYDQGYLVGLQEGSWVGYQEGSKIGYVNGNEGDQDSSDGTGFYFVYNPTYDEVREILAEGEIGSTREIHDYAEANGIRAAYVRVKIARQAAEGKIWVYRLVAFETVDHGLIIIEPWSHEEVKVEVGKRYRELNGFPTSLYDDTITKITIVW